MAKYLDNVRFTAAIIEYGKLCEENERLAKPKPKISDFIGVSLVAIANNLAKKRNFSSYTWLDKMIEDGVMAMVAAVPKFDVTKLPEGKKPNAMAYFTTCCNRAFINRITHENEQLGLNDKIVELDADYRFTLGNFGLMGEYNTESDFPNIHSNNADLINLHNKVRMTE